MNRVDTVSKAGNHVVSSNKAVLKTFLNSWKNGGKFKNEPYGFSQKNISRKKVKLFFGNFSYYYKLHFFRVFHWNFFSFSEDTKILFFNLSICELFLSIFWIFWQLLVEFLAGSFPILLERHKDTKKTKAHIIFWKIYWLKDSSRTANYFKLSLHFHLKIENLILENKIELPMSFISIEM